ncbi:MAG TPA: hypothetical protein VNU66_08090 [Mycobacteriales bacterium]|nr:hypothetical protein [Mycobacteriales bacterium]
MLARKLQSLGVTSDLMHVAALGSIAASILTWRAAKSSGDAAHAERFGIFVGLWAPTFFALADALATVETADRR